MKIVKSAVVISLCVLLLSLSSYAQRDGDAFLDSKNLDINIDEASTFLALKTISNAVDIPIGFEAATSESFQSKRFTLDARKKSLRETLQSLVNSDDRYKWEVDSGVVLVSPVTAERDLFIKELLSTRINNLSLDLYSDLLEIRQKLVDTDSIKFKLKEQKISPVIFSVTSYGHRKVNRSKFLHLSGVTLQEALNTIVRETNFKCWIVNRFGDKREFLVLNF